MILFRYDVVARVFVESLINTISANFCLIAFIGEIKTTSGYGFFRCEFGCFVKIHYRGDP